jgi:hypothetical protein
MLQQIIFIVTLAGFMACTPNKEQNNTAPNAVVDSVAVVNDPKNNLNIQTNSFSEIDSSGILMFPLLMAETERDGGSLWYKSMPGGSYWNIIFLNSRTSDYHLLSEQKMLIKNYDFKYSSNGNADITQTKKYIFYNIVTTDYNADKFLSYEDPGYLFVSDKEGNNFRQISPPNYDVQNWQFVKASGKIILTVKKDSDKNNKFDDKDEVTTFEADIEKGTAAAEVFSTEFKNKLKILFDRDWKRVKK